MAWTGHGRSRPGGFRRWLRLAASLQPPEKDGYSVSVVQNPTLSLEGDVAATTADESEVRR